MRCTCPAPTVITKRVPHAADGMGGDRERISDIPKEAGVSQVGSKNQLKGHVLVLPGLLFLFYVFPLLSLRGDMEAVFPV